MRFAHLGLILVAGPAMAAAQDVPPQESDVVISGKRVSEKQAVRRQIAAITARVHDDKPLARFHDPVCIGTSGLPREAGMTVLDRMIEIAQDSGLPTRDGKCTPNIMVIFADDAGTQIDTLAKRGGGSFTGLDLSDVRALRRQNGPAYFWGSSEVRSRDGDQLQSSGQGDDAPGGPPTLRVSTASHISPPIRYDMRTAILVIERNALLGKSLRQVADYAAMRAFARTREPEAPALPTILSLFAPDATPPAELTAFDRGYLQGLYRGAANTFAHTAQQRIAREIAEVRQEHALE